MSIKVKKSKRSIIGIISIMLIMILTLSLLGYFTKGYADWKNQIDEVPNSGDDNINDAILPKSLTCMDFTKGSALYSYPGSNDVNIPIYYKEFNGKFNLGNANDTFVDVLKSEFCFTDDSVSFTCLSDSAMMPENSFTCNWFYVSAYDYCPVVLNNVYIYLIDGAEYSENLNFLPIRANSNKSICLIYKLYNSLDFELPETFKVIFSKGKKETLGTPQIIGYNQSCNSISFYGVPNYNSYMVYGLNNGGTLFNVSADEESIFNIPLNHWTGLIVGQEYTVTIQSFSKKFSDFYSSVMSVEYKFTYQG